MKKLFYSLKFYLISILAVGISLYSCKKEPAGDLSTGPYYMRFKANGTQANYTIPVSALSGDTLKQGISHDSIFSLGKKIHIFTFGAADIHLHSLGIGVYTDSLLKSGYSYKESELLYGSQPMSVFILNQKSDGTPPYISAWAYSPPDDNNISPTCTLTIDQITPTFMKGTFSGIVYKPEDSGDINYNDKVTITGGEFYLPII